MAQFIDYSSFIFDGFHSDMFGVSMVSTDSNNTERIFGLNSSIETQDGIGDVKIPIRRKNNTYSFAVEIMKLNQWNQVLPMSEKEYDDIIRWLMKKEVGRLEIGGLLHYGYFKSGTEFHNPNRQGIIKLEFESVCPYAYTPIMTSNIRVLGNKTFELRNKSNLNEKVYLDIYIEKLNSIGSVEIINLRNGNTFKINDLELGEKVKITGENCLEIESLTNPKRNLFKSAEYSNFPFIDYGTNKFKIIGDCNMVIKYQLPIALR